MEKYKKRKGYSYSFSAEKIRWWQSVPPKDKLKWLSEANDFLNKIMPEKNKKIAADFRAGRV